MTIPPSYARACQVFAMMGRGARPPLVLGRRDDAPCACGEAQRSALCSESGSFKRTLEQKNNGLKRSKGYIRGQSQAQLVHPKHKYFLQKCAYFIKPNIRPYCMMTTVGICNSTIRKRSFEKPSTFVLKWGEKRGSESVIFAGRLDELP